MILTGDVACVQPDSFEFLGFENLINKPWCFNLEGAILPIEAETPDWGIYNSSNWLDSFSGFNLGPIFLANNHIHDLPGGIEYTRKWLEHKGLNCFGAGSNYKEASRSAIVESGGQRYTLLGFGWPVIGCRAVTTSMSGVNRLEGRQVLSQAHEALNLPNPGHVVVVIHGNYEFEKYPQPGHRKLARQLIDEGVYAVVCHHPHVVSPVERYKGRTIAYSLGNWAFSYERFFGGRHKFPNSSFHQIALELAPDGDKVHHATFEPPNVVRYRGTELVVSDDFSLRPEFEGFNNQEYSAWFRVNRLKSKGLPVYISSESSVTNLFRDFWVGLRQRIIAKAVAFNIKKVTR